MEAYGLVEMYLAGLQKNPVILKKQLICTERDGMTTSINSIFF